MSREWLPKIRIIEDDTIRWLKRNKRAFKYSVLSILIAPGLVASESYVPGFPSDSNNAQYLRRVAMHLLQTDKQDSFEEAAGFTRADFQKAKEGLYYVTFFAEKGEWAGNCTAWVAKEDPERFYLAARYHCTDEHGELTSVAMWRPGIDTEILSYTPDRVVSDQHGDFAVIEFEKSNNPPFRGKALNYRDRARFEVNQNIMLAGYLPSFTFQNGSDSNSPPWVLTYGDVAPIVVAPSRDNSVAQADSYASIGGSGIIAFGKDGAGGIVVIGTVGAYDEHKPPNKRDVLFPNGRPARVNIDPLNLGFLMR